MKVTPKLETVPTKLECKVPIIGQLRQIEAHHAAVILKLRKRSHESEVFSANEQRSAESLVAKASRDIKTNNQLLESLLRDLHQQRGGDVMLGLDRLFL